MQNPNNNEYRRSTLLMRLSAFMQSLVEPPAKVANIATRYKSRLLATFLLVMFLLFGMLDISYYMTPGYQTTAESIMGYAIIIICYILIRTGLYPVAATLTMAMFPMVLFSEVIRNESNNPIVTLNFLTLNLFLGSILFSAWGTIGFALVNVIGIALMPVLAQAAVPDMLMIIGPLATNVIGAALAVIAIVHRNTIERKRQAELTARESWFRTIYDGVNDAIFIHDADTGRILDVNSRTCEMYACDRDDLLHLTIADVSQGKTPFSQREAVVWIQKAKTEGPQIFEWRARNRDGHLFWVEVNLRQARIDGQDRILAAVRNITERKQAEALRESLIEELETKNAQLERFVYTVSHDLKSPLITIKGFLGYLERDAGSADADQMHRDIEHIAAATDKMKLLLDDLLELSRVGRLTNPPEQIPVTELAYEAADTVAGTLHTHNVQIKIAPDMPIVIGDRPRMREIWENLFSNAAKFMGEQAHPCIEVGVRDQDVETVFFVRDNGMGIEPRYQKRIFDLFEKLDPESEGTGIGLAIVKRIVETHGGRIWVESEGLGNGSTFCFTLPHLTPPLALPEAVVS